MKFIVTTKQYEFAHNKRPRGTGAWAFYFDSHEDIWFAPGMLTYAEALKKAKEEAAKRKATVITVAS